MWDSQRAKDEKLGELKNKKESVTRKHARKKRWTESVIEKELEQGVNRKRE